MAITWYVIANRAGARILEARPDRPLRLVEVIEHESGRLKNRELDTDRAGSGYDSARAGVRAKTKSESAHEHNAADFARDLAGGLEAARNDRSFDYLVLVAEPHLLGLIRRALDVATASRVGFSINRDLTHVPLHALASQLQRLAG
ncbi:MAG: host attachment protein [Myxococcales bacterium]|nr:host attachment protein [Myxococcales bacterium]